jgi:phosphate transport system protein
MVRHLNAYDRALLEIRDQVKLMTEKVANRLEQALRVLNAPDDAMAQALIGADDEIDAMDETIEMESLELISLQQPVDRDLRFLAAAIRISRELERIGDYACDIAKSALHLSKTTGFELPVDLPVMFNQVQIMLSKSLRAYLENDLDAARRMDDEDDAVDQLFLVVWNRLTDYIKRNPDNIEEACSLLLVVRYLERIGDHLVNIAEMTIFTETGERHPYKARKAEETG